MTLLHELKERGIPVAVASDNTRDPFYAYGDMDMMEVFREAVRVLHLDHPIAVVGDPMQPQGGAVFEISRGSLDASVETQLAEIERGLIDQLEARV